MPRRVTLPTVAFIVENNAVRSCTCSNMYSPKMSRPCPEVINFFCAQLNGARNFNCSSTLKYRKMKKFHALSLTDVVFIMLINVKMPTIIGILTFMSMIDLMLS